MIGPVLISLRGNMEISAVTHTEVTQLELSTNLRNHGEGPCQDPLLIEIV